jgi:hypothetical protein
MSHRKNRLRGHSALVQSQFKPPSVRTGPISGRTVTAFKAYTVSFTNARPGPGRHHRATYQSACVIAVSPADAAAKAERYAKVYLPKLYLEEVRLDDNVVIIETDEDGALA